MVADIEPKQEIPIEGVLNAVMRLKERGYATIPHCELLCTQAPQYSFAKIVDQYALDDLLKFSFAHEERPDGSFDPDDGMLRRDASTGSKDVKNILHYRPRLWSLVYDQNSKERYPSEIFNDMIALMHLCEKVYLSHMDLALTLMEAFDLLRLLPCSLKEELEYALRKPEPTSRSVLRLLYYQTAVEGVCARVHFDRAFLTIHAGGDGGDLFIRHPDGSDEVVETSFGEVLVFWGAKAQLIAQEHNSSLLQPVAHGSCGSNAESRTAMVSFWHINRLLYDAPQVPY